MIDVLVQAKLAIHIRWMIRLDIPAVGRIEAASDAFAWSAADFVAYLRQRQCIGMVAEVGARVVGFMIYDLERTRFHLRKLAVDPDFRRRKIGAQMIERLKGKLTNHRRRSIDVLVRERNLDSQRFFRCLGFTAHRVLRGHFDDSGEDAYQMQYQRPGGSS